MNVMQNKNCLFNGHLKEKSNHVGINKHQVDVYKYKNDNITTVNNAHEKNRLTDKLKGLLENGDARKDEDPYTFSEYEYTSTQGYNTAKNTQPNYKNYQLSKPYNVKNSKTSGSNCVSTTQQPHSFIEHTKVNNLHLKHQTGSSLHAREKATFNKCLSPTSNNISQLLKTSSPGGKPLSYTKLRNSFTKDSKKLDLNNKYLNVRSNSGLCNDKSKLNIPRSLSLDCDVSNINEWNCSTKKPSLLEESLLGLKNYGRSKEIRPSTLLHTGTTTVVVPSKTKKDMTVVKTSSRHDSLQRIWTVRNKIVRLKNDHTQFGTDIGYNETDYDSDNDVVTVQNHWFSLYNDTDTISYKDRRRDAKLSQAKLEYRHKLKQMNSQHNDEYRDSMVDILIQSARIQPNLTALLVHLCKTNCTRNQFRLKSTAANRSLCTYADSNGHQCDYLAIPLSNYCQQHIVYCQEQMLFTMCSARRDDHTQCKAPVLDNIVEAPMCLEHKRLKLLSQKPKKQVMKQATQARKRSRSSTSSGRSGRSRKRKRSLKDKKEDSTTKYITNITTASGMITSTTATAAGTMLTQQIIGTIHHNGGTLINTTVSQHNHLPYLTNSLSNMNAQVITKSDVDECQEVEVLADLPLDTAELATQATRLLEEHDFTNVLNHIPADAFNDLFTVDKGEYEPTPQETEELERALEAVDKDVKSLEKLSQTQGILETLLDEQAALALAAHLPPTLVPVLYQNGYVDDVSKTLVINDNYQTDVKQS